MRARLHGLLFAGLLTVSFGCGDKADSGVVVTGTVTKDGSPMKFGDSEGVTLTLSNGTDTFTSNVDADSKFSVQKPAGGGIPAGKYKVKYTHYQNETPYAKNRRPFRNEKELPEQWDVSPSNNTFTLDIGKKK